MEITLTVLPECGLLTLNGRLDAVQAPKVTGAVQKALREGPANLLVDCSLLSYVASMGLRSFLLAQKEAVNVGGKLIFFGVNDNVRSVFTMTGFDKIITLRANREEALACL